MKCLYRIDGHTIGDIKKFNDFLLKYKRYSKNVNDLVFSKRWDRAIACIEEARKKSSDLELKYQEAKRNALYSDGEEILRATRPYVGVSEFLSGLKNEAGKYMIPEFIPNNYWAERYRRWAVADFTDDEIQEFFGGDKSAVTAVDLGNQATWEKDDKGNYKDGFGTDILKRYREQMTKRWKMLALYGTAIHNVLETFFSRTTGGNYWYDLLSDDSTRGLHMSTIYTKHTREITDPNNPSIKYPGLTKEQVDLVIDYAILLKKSIESTYGKNVKYYPEFTLSAKLNKEYEGRTDLLILGRTDLLILDGNGNPHIIDYKTSPRIYDDYKEAKKLAFTYQLGTYERMLRRAGLNTTATQITVAPIQMENFRNEDGVYKFDNVKTATPTTSMLESLNERIYESTNISSNMDEYIEAPLVLDGDTENIISTVTERMSKVFPNYGDVRKKTDEEIRERINKQLGSNWINRDTGFYEFLPIPGSHFTIKRKAQTPEDEVKFFEDVKKFYTGAKERNVKKTQDIIKVVRQAQENDTDAVDWPSGTDQWFVNRMSKYLSKEWKVLDGEAQDAAEQFGMILMYNEDLDVIDVVKISSSNLHHQNNFGPRRLNITGGLGIDDNIENTKSNSLILKATDGNIEMMEAMMVLNNIRFNVKGGINLGNITVLTPKGDIHGKSEGLPASNKELLYSWKAINRALPLDGDDNFKNGNIRMLSAAEQCYMEFKHIMSRVGVGYNNKFQKFTPALTQLHNALITSNADRVVALEALNQLRKKLEDDFGFKGDITQNLDAYTELPNYTHQNYAKILYQQVNKAILELNGIDIRQMTKAHSNYCDSHKILSDGLQGMMIDNAGLFGSEILNKVTGMVLEGYLNARDSASRELRTLRDKVEDLKRAQGYSGLKEHTYGNQSSLYDKMTYYAPNGDLLFVNPWKHPEKLGGAKNVEFLKYAILLFNKNVHPELTQDQIDQRILDDDIAFFQVPLVESTFASQVNSEGWGSWLKNKFKMFKDKETFKQYLKDKASDYLSDSEEQVARDRAIFETVNMMDQGHGDKRLELIQSLRNQKGDGFFERNIENLLGAHIWAYSTQRALENRMPLLKAAYISLAIAGNELNWDYSNEKEFFKKFVQNRVNKLSIMDEHSKMFKSLVAPVLQAASWVSLAFSPVLFGYQSLEGIWKDCKLIFTKPDGKETFTVENMKDAFLTVYRELGHYSDKASVCESVNAFYGINDMDNASFALNNSSDNHGIFNFFGKFAYKFSSRPDFYNRMTIFVAQMKNDGCWKAHKIDKDNQLVYDWKEDDRFKAYAKGDHSNEEEYQKAKALYYTVAQQLVTEGATNVDGTLFKVGDALPKAYSNKESEAMKAVADTMYGYYDSTKKSMFSSIFLGSLKMQMLTFWSAKKNQYLGKGGHKVQGEWRVAKDPEGNELYYSKDENGEIDQNAPLVTKDDPNCSGTKFLQWKGKYEEGILITLWDMAKLAYLKRSFKEAWDEKWNNQDEDMRKTYQSNLKSLFADFILMILIGGLAAAMMEEADELANEAKKSLNPGDVAFATSFGLAAKMVRNSSLDFAWYQSIFEPTIEWKPFSFSWAQSEYENIANWVTGDATFAKTIGKSFGAARNVKPIFTYLDQKTKE